MKSVKFHTRGDVWFIHFCFLFCLLNSIVDGGFVNSMDVDTKDNTDLISKRSSSAELKYLGCYDAWKSHIPAYTTSGFYELLSLDKCEKHCLNNGGFERSDIYVIRGLFCGCLPWSTVDFDKLIQVDEEHCSISCTKSESGEYRSCGGNHAFSFYCNQTGIEGEKCKNLELYPISQLGYDFQDAQVHVKYESDSSMSSESSESKSVETDVSLTKPNILQPKNISILPCFNCTNPYRCTTSSFDSNLIYMPKNTPKHCIEFCSKSLQFYNVKTDNVEIRDSTKYANVGWSYRGIPVSTCGCFNEIPQHVELTLNFCNKPCPGNFDQMCGGEPPFVFTLYGANSDHSSYAGRPTIWF